MVCFLPSRGVGQSPKGAAGSFCWRVASASPDLGPGRACCPWGFVRPPTPPDRTRTCSCVHSSESTHVCNCRGAVRAHSERHVSSSRRCVCPLILTMRPRPHGPSGLLADRSSILAVGNRPPAPVVCLTVGFPGTCRAGAALLSWSWEVARGPAHPAHAHFLPPAPGAPGRSPPRLAEAGQGTASRRSSVACRERHRGEPGFPTVPGQPGPASVDARSTTRHPFEIQKWCWL